MYLANTWTMTSRLRDKEAAPAQQEIPRNGLARLRQIAAGWNALLGRVGAFIIFQEYPDWDELYLSPIRLRSAMLWGKRDSQMRGGKPR